MNVKNLWKISSKVLLFSFLVLCGVILITGTALAATESNNLPWEKALSTLMTSITGPVAIGVSLIAIVAAGVALIFGGDMQGFMRTAAYLALVIGIIVAAANVLSSLYGKSINVPEPPVMVISADK
jgi:type IV secretion system protein VirB2